MDCSQQIPIDCYNHVVLLINCKLSMFIAHPSPFKKIITAAFNFYDSTVVDKDLPKNFLSVLFLHPEPTKQVLVDFAMNPVEAYQAIFKLTQLPNAKAKDLYATNNTGLFFHQLINAMNLLKNKTGQIFFFTTEKDPTTTTQDKHNTMHYFKETNKWRKKFKILAKAECLSSFCELFKISKEYGMSYETVEHLSDKILESVYQDNLGYRINMHPYLGSKHFITCSIFGLGHGLEITNSGFVHKESRKVLRSKMAEDEPHKNAMKHSKRVVIPVGISPIEASPVKDGVPYADIGLSVRPTFLLGNSSISEKCFAQFWETMNEAYVLCYVKFVKLGPIHVVELTAVKFHGERYFEMRFIPSIMESGLPINFQPYKDKVPISKPAKERDREQLFDLVMGKMTLNRVNEFLSGRSLDNWMEQEYIKSQLLGPDYKMVPAPYNLFRASGPADEDIEKLCASLDQNSEIEDPDLDASPKMQVSLKKLEPFIPSDSESSEDAIDEADASESGDDSSPGALFPHGPIKLKPEPILVIALPNHKYI